MRKRKASPSSEWATSPTDLESITERTETAAVLGDPSGCSQPTVPQSGPEVPANGHPPHGANVAPTSAVTPTRIEGGVTESRTGDPVEVRVPIGPRLPLQELVSEDQLEGADVDVAGGHAPERHWFWELLEEAGYDVW